MLFSKKIQNVTKTSSSILTLFGEQLIKLCLHLYSILFSKKKTNKMLQKLLVQFWHFSGSNSSNCAFNSTVCYLAKKMQIVTKPLLQFWHFLGSSRSNCTFTLICYLSKKIRNVTKTSSSILTLLGEQPIKSRLHLYSILIGEKNPKYYKNLYFNFAFFGGATDQIWPSPLLYAF